MKLDKIRFAKLVQYITNLNHQNYLELDVLDNLCEINVEPVISDKTDPKLIDELLYHMQTATGDGFVSSIRAYRSLTGVGLKEAKEAVERYRIYVGKTLVSEAASLNN